MKTKTKNILRWIPSIIVALLTVGGAAFKFSGVQALIVHYTQLGLLPYVKLFGAAELTFLALFLYPRTMKIGLLLLTAELGGAMAVELSHGSTFVPPMMILALVWISAYLRQPSIFKMKSDEQHQPAYTI